MARQQLERWIELALGDDENAAIQYLCQTTGLSRREARRKVRELRTRIGGSQR